jgi:hypothetical protein
VARALRVNPAHEQSLLRRERIRKLALAQRQVRWLWHRFADRTSGRIDREALSRLSEEAGNGALCDADWLQICAQRSADEAPSSSSSSPPTSASTSSSQQEWLGGLGELEALYLGTGLWSSHLHSDHTTIAATKLAAPSSPDVEEEATATMMMALADADAEEEEEEEEEEEQEQEQEQEQEPEGADPFPIGDLSELFNAVAHSLSQLRTLNLTGCSLRADAVVALATALGRPRDDGGSGSSTPPPATLKSLQLDGNAVGLRCDPMPSTVAARPFWEAGSRH